MTDIAIFIAVVVLAFLVELLDSMVGMGYGTIMSPLLLIIGFGPLQAVPGILVSELVLAAVCSIIYHKFDIAHWDFRKDLDSAIVKRLGKLGYFPRSQDSKIGYVLGLCSIVGAVVGVIFALSLPKSYLTLAIGLMIIVMGVLILVKRRAVLAFSWLNIVVLGTVAAFNKAFSGGGYGPLITSGQVLSGAETKNSVAVTAFAKGVVAVVGVVTYFVLGKSIDWSLAPFLIVGAVCAIPISASQLKKIDIKKFTGIIGLAAMALGLFMVYNIKW